VAVSRESLLEMSGVSRDYSGHWAVWDVNLKLRRGQVLGLLGQNGAGKSTTLAMMAGNLAPRSGTIRVGAVDLQEHPVLAKRQIGYLPDQPPVHPELTVDEYLRYAARLHRVSRAQLGSALTKAKRSCGLHSQGRQLIGSLSKGYQQRVGIAQAIVHEPDVVILDEPTVGLDPIQLIEIRKLIIALGENRGVILSSHLLNEVETICTHVLLMQLGRVRFAAALDQADTERRQVLRIRLQRPPESSVLATLPGVEGVEPLGDGEFVIRTSAGVAPAEQLVRESCHGDWGLTLLAPEPRRLERMFVDLSVAAPADDLPL